VAQKAAKREVVEVGGASAPMCRTFSSPFAMHVLDRGQGTRTTQELLGHKEESKTMVYNHVLIRGPLRFIAQQTLRGKLNSRTVVNREGKG